MLYAIFLARLASDPASIGLRWMGLPNERDLKPFVDIGKAVVSRNVLLMATYNLLTCVSSFLGTAAMAAHQCGVAVFWLISMGVEPVSIAAQTLVARDMCRPRLVKSLAFTLLKIGAWAGALLSVITAGESTSSLCPPLPAARGLSLDHSRALVRAPALWCQPFGTILLVCAPWG